MVCVLLRSARSSISVHHALQCAMAECSCCSAASRPTATAGTGFRQQPSERCVSIPCGTISRSCGRGRLPESPNYASARLTMVAKSEAHDVMISVPVGRKAAAVGALMTYLRMSDCCRIAARQLRKDAQRASIHPERKAPAGEHGTWRANH